MNVNVAANRLLSVRNSENQQQLQGQMIMTVPIHDRPRLARGRKAMVAHREER